jgi:hypothetical protein
MVAHVSSGSPCDKDGYELPGGPHPPPDDNSGPIDFTPFGTRAEFEFTEFLYSEVKMSVGKIDKLLEILAALYPECAPSIADHRDLYQRIDSIQQGDIAWDSFSVQYNCALLTPNAPKLPWMDQKFEVWFRNPLHILKNQICNPDFKDEVDYAPKQIYYKGKCRYENLMSGNWAWEQAICTKSKLVQYLTPFKDKISQDVTDLQGPPSERTQSDKIRDLKSLAKQYARDQGSCDDTRISYLEYVESEAEADWTLARMIAG